MVVLRLGLLPLINWVVNNCVLFLQRSVFYQSPTDQLGSFLLIVLLQSVLPELMPIDDLSIVVVVR